MVDNFPDNDKYKNWLIASKTIIVKKYSYILLLAVLLCLVLQKMVNNENSKLKFTILITATALFTLAIVIEIFKFVVKAKVKNQ